MTNKATIRFTSAETATFVRGETKQHVIDNGAFAMMTGKVRIADGTEYDALIELCVVDSGEHYGTGLWVDDGVTFQDDDDFLKRLGKTAEQVFPYRYNYSPHYVSSDHHVGDDGWSY